MFTFLPGSKLVIDNNGSGVTINPESISIDQTFQETNFSLKTIQTPNMVKESLVQKRAQASFSFTYHMDAGAIDSVIWGWAGLVESNTLKFDINPVITARPIEKDFYLATLNKNVKVSNAVLEDIEVQVGHDKIAKLVISGSAKLVEVLNTIPFTPSTTEQNYLGNNFIDVNIGGTGLQSVLTSSLSIRKSITWLDQPTIHSRIAGDIYVPTVPIQTEFSVSGRYTILLTDNNLTARDDSIILTSGAFKLNLDNCTISDRVGIEKVLTKSLDFKMRPQSSDSYIQYI